MASPSIVAARAQLANEKAIEVIAQHGRAERIENLQTITVAQAVVRNPHHLAGFHAELIAGLAEIIGGLVSDNAALTDRIVALENPPTTAAGTGAEKAGKKA